MIKLPDKTKGLLRLFLAPVALAIVGSLLLLAASLIPNAAVRDKAVLSAEELVNKPDPAMGSDRLAYVMDYHTDSLIIMEAYTLSSDEPESVFTNPMLYLGDGFGSTALEEMLAGREPNVNYVRYWMGFRILIRPLLAVFSYDSICWLYSMVFFSLAFVLLGAVGARCGTGPAACFALALALVNPAVIAHSPQYICCFILSFIFMLVLLAGCTREERLRSSSWRVEKLCLYFCVFGALTQFFDFYTSPVITCAFPLLLLAELDALPGKRYLAGLKCVGAWLYGYVAMWLLKLAAVTAFTEEDGFANGFASLGSRLSLTGAEDSYSVSSALRRVWSVVFPGGLTLPSALLFALLVLFSAAVILKRRGPRALGGALIYPMLAMLPLVWFAVAAQPTYIHAWFQYRGLAAFFLAIFLFAAEAWKKEQ